MKYIELKKEASILNNKTLSGINITKSFEDTKTLRLHVNMAIISDSK